MNPISPVFPDSDIPEVVFAKDQPEYIPLPAVYLKGSPQGAVLTRWKLSEEEKEKIRLDGDLVITPLTFNRPLQPIHLKISLSGEKPNTDHILEEEYHG